VKNRVFIVEDHPITRRGYRALLNAEPDLEVCGEASTGIDALALLASARPDVVVVDMTIEHFGGLELIKYIQTTSTSLPILVVSSYDESVYAERALRAGARGFLRKHDVDETLVSALRSVLGGAYHVSNRLNSHLLQRYASGAAGAGFESPTSALTDRELEVFALLGNGRSTREIAETMLISPKTVETHRQRIKEKLAIESTNELLRRAVEWVHLSLQAR
jgi:two-component system, NarL family, response regulator NreC